MFNKKQGILILPHSLTNFEIRKYYRKEPRFNGVYSRDNLTDKKSDGTYVINLDEYSDSGTHWIALHAMNNSVTYFDSFGAEPIQKEVKIFIDKSIFVTNIFRIQAYDSVMWGYCCTGFIACILKGKTLADFTNLSPNNFRKEWWYNLKLFYE